jgi:membrane fusion protein, multidrug efflux system
MQKKKYLYLMLAILLVGLAVYGMMHLRHAEEHHIKHSFLVTKPWRDTVEIEKEYVAQVKAIQHIEVRSLEKGYLQNIYVDEGQLVKKGQKMFQIMPLVTEANFNESKASYEVARIEYSNTRSLAVKNVVSQNELALMKAKLDKAKAHMDLMQTHLKLTTVEAPFDGLMDKFRVRLGSLVKEGQILTTLSDNSQIWVYFNVSEADYLNYMKLKDKNPNMPIDLRLANGDIFPHKGKIDTIEADFDNETGNVAFRATFPNPDRLLRQGETGNVVLKNMFDNALIIPQKATFEILDKKFIYVVDKDNILQSRQIVVENELPHLFLVKSGIDENDTILLEGFGKVKPLDTIDAKPQTKEEVIKGLELSVK